MREKLRDIQFWLCLIWLTGLLGSCQLPSKQDKIIEELREIKQEMRNEKELS